MKRATQFSVGLFAAVLAVALMAGCAKTKAVSGNSEFGVNLTPFQTIDLNLDGQISGEEFEVGFFRLAFVTLDQNDDMRIDVIEWRKVEDQPDAEQMFKSMDKDGNQSLTYAEFSEPDKKEEVVGNIFKTIDANGDGVLTREEAAKSRASASR